MSEMFRRYIPMFYDRGLPEHSSQSKRTKSFSFSEGTGTMGDDGRRADVDLPAVCDDRTTELEECSTRQVARSSTATSA